MSKENMRWSGVSFAEAAVALGVTSSSTAIGLSVTGVGTAEQGSTEPGVLGAAGFGVCAKGSLPDAGGVGILGASTSTRATSELSTDMWELLDSLSSSTQGYRERTVLAISMEHTEELRRTIFPGETISVPALFGIAGILFWSESSDPSEPIELILVQVSYDSGCL